MIALITGGAASGKSELAEAVSNALGGKVAYIATMQPFGEEANKRIARHLKLREGKGFLTVERYTDLAGVSESLKDRADTLLIECLSNLCANELFSLEGAGANTVSAILDGVCALSKRYLNLVIVTNEVFSDGVSYDQATMEYQQKLGELNLRLAEMADSVVEVVCGIPLFHKDQSGRIKELITK